jgi:E3 ubiquitin-protein ligase RFWD2
MAARSATPNSGGEGCSSAASPLSRSGSATSLRSSRASKRQLNGSQATLAGATADLTCPVCLELLEEAHITRCGHTFCFRCIAKSLDSAGGRCPKCGAAVSGLDQVFPNFVLNELVAKHRQQTEIPGDLRDLVAAESSRMTLPDLNAVLELLTQRKQLLEAETSAAQNRLLQEFLRHLLSQREEQLTRLTREVALIKRDIAHVENVLQNSEAESPTINDCPLLAARRKRMHSHFDDFVHCYFSTRARELILGDESNSNSLTRRSQQEAEEEGLERFRDNLVKFSRYNSLRPVATLNYSSGAAFNASTIVSSIEFDKDDELFAIAGVTKRIKVFDYGAVARDAVDIHYPCVEMVSSSKISCVSWNAYHKATLVSSDYEGAVTVWDVATGARSKVFQVGAEQLKWPK